VSFLAFIDDKISLFLFGIKAIDVLGTMHNQLPCLPCYLGVQLLCWQCYTHSLMHAFIHAFIRSFVHSFIHSFIFILYVLAPQQHCILGPS